MKRSELKTVLKPLIKECIKEVILEEGVLSNVISEVIKGVGANTIVEQKTEPVQQERLFSVPDTPKPSRIGESRKHLMDSIGKDAYNGVNLFEDVQPISEAGSASGPSPSAHGPLSGQDPNDPGVNISGLMNLAANNWKKFI
jgi:hypothetical protein